VDISHFKHKKTVIFDMDETLVSAITDREKERYESFLLNVDGSKMEGDDILDVVLDDGDKFSIVYVRRPYADGILAFYKDLYNVVIYTAGA
jgi:TFIIF-interacting CTD phosphatase-like protein